MGEFLREWFGTWKAVMVRPRSYFADMDVAGGLGEPIGFFAVILAVNCVVGLIMLITRQGVTPLDIVQLALWVVLVGAAGAGMAFGLQFLAGRLGGTGDLEGTVRALSFSCATNVLFWIPFIGMIPLVHTLMLSTLGLAAVHRMPIYKSALIAIPFVAFFVAVNLFLWLSFRSVAPA